MWKQLNERHTFVLFGQIVCHVEQDGNGFWHPEYDNTLKLWCTTQSYATLEEVVQYVEDTLYEWMETCIESRE